MAAQSLTPDSGKQVSYLVVLRFLLLKLVQGSSLFSSILSDFLHCQEVDLERVDACRTSFSSYESSTATENLL